MKSLFKPLLCTLLLIMVAAGWGCATAESDNAAERPWNAPKNWEHGLPPSIMEGR